MVFAGDVMGHDMQITGAWRDGGDTSYNYHPVFQYIGDYISAFDIALANLEVTLAGPPYKGYPEFSSHRSLAEALKNTGFNVLVTANNHSLDRGKKGLESTLNALDSIGIAHTGTFRDSAEWRANYPLIVEKNNFRLAILNYTYGTNGIPVAKPNVVSMIDTAQIAADLGKAKSLKPDYIITCIHWGDEYQNPENASQRALAAFLAAHGTNLIIGSHPHVVQPLSTVNDSVYVIYSLGNFVSNQRDRYRDGGITLEATLIKKDGKATLKSVGYEPFYVYRCHENKKPPSVFRLIRINDYLKRPERYPAIDAADKKLMMQFYNDTKATMGR
ncbi:MAG: CapA family protein [Chitinispirillales bacterium]|jgi:poly-gamma-glutamate synthesis protein (capsule biosynthesis protein)|nr:CapA family protein [Chitinispirillales bacterium]